MNSEQLRQEFLSAVRIALAEDLGAGDATTLATVPSRLRARAELAARENCIIAGLAAAEIAFRELDPHCRFDILLPDGSSCGAGAVVAIVEGEARALLSAERVALNFVQRLSGIATLTSRFVEKAAGSRCRILDTRKTTPGLRALEKYAVTCGGGDNHRMGLYDRIMIKDNHRELAALAGPGGIARSVRAAREAYPQLQVEVEADTLEEVREAVEARADFILLDNMSNDEMAEAVRIVGQRALLEASGNMKLDRIASVAALGVDFISVGALTHSARAIDLGLDIRTV
ncbi:MAG: hypothetical protein RL095_2719 [Verrucomicrobiota bacterium]|jgi:nicotinate-nucleotide pyrophosphorylase (carboxylating)